MADTPREPQADNEQPLVTHLIELRNRLLHAVLAVLVIFAGLVYFSNDLYTLLAGPLLAHLPAEGTMIATDVASPFLTPLKLALVASVFAAMPFILYQVWAFVAPGLYTHERKLVYPLMVSSIFLFYAGMAFAYFVVFPLVFGFFTATAPAGVAVMTDISKYLDFVLTIFFAFGVAFEVPIFTILLVWTGMTTPEKPARETPLHHRGSLRGGHAADPARRVFPDPARHPHVAAVRGRSVLLPLLPEDKGRARTGGGRGTGHGRHPGPLRSGTGGRRRAG